MPRGVSLFQLLFALVALGLARGCYYWYWLENPNDYNFRRCQAGCGQSLAETAEGYYECCMPMSSGVPTPSICSSIISANSGKSTCKSTNVATTDMPTSYYSKKPDVTLSDSTSMVNALPTSSGGGGGGGGGGRGGGGSTSTVWETITTTTPCPSPSSSPPPSTSIVNALPTSLSTTKTATTTTDSTSASGSASASGGGGEGNSCTCTATSSNASPTPSGGGYEGALPPRAVLHGWKKRTGDECTCPPVSSATTTTEPGPSGGGSACACSSSGGEWEGNTPGKRWMAARTGGACDCGFEGATPALYEPGRRDVPTLRALPPPDFTPDNRRRMITRPPLLARGTPGIVTVTSTATITTDDCAGQSTTDISHTSTVNAQPTSSAVDDPYEDCDDQTSSGFEGAMPTTS